MPMMTDAATAAGAVAVSPTKPAAPTRAPVTKKLNVNNAASEPIAILGGVPAAISF